MPKGHFCPHPLAPIFLLPLIRERGYMAKDTNVTVHLAFHRCFFRIPLITFFQRRSCAWDTLPPFPPLPTRKKGERASHEH